MANIYLKNLKTKAVTHTLEMEKQFNAEANATLESLKIYGGDNGLIPEKAKRGKCEAKIVVDRMDSAKSVFAHNSGKTAVLNFASYKNPGGKFFEGSVAQEECLCHASNLYNVLSECGHYYDWNKKHNNKALYTDRAIYLKDIVFIDESVCVYGIDPTVLKADVITCAAPNYYAAGKYANVSNDENEEALAQRIKFVLDVAEDNGVETLILGAFGCGIFGQDAMVVAKYFKKYLNKYNYHFKNVYFSIYDRTNHGNYSSFDLMFH